MEKMGNDYTTGHPLKVKVTRLQINMYRKQKLMIKQKKKLRMIAVRHKEV